jgi:hypothetical protein
MKRYIYLRSSLDWKKIRSIDDYIEANINARPLVKDWLPRLVRAIEEWDVAFNMKYFEFRERMKEITMSNLLQIKDATIVTKYEKKIFENETDDFVIYPIDDDDWVSKNVFDSVCSDLGEQDDVAVWPFGFFRGSRIMLTDIKEPIDDIRWIYSNNAILTRKGYEKFHEVCAECDFLEDHREADVYCGTSGCFIKVIHKALSVYNQSPGSATKLWGLSAGNKTSRDPVISLISDYKKVPNAPKELAWSLPYAKKAWRLISNLQQSKFFL